MVELISGATKIGWLDSGVAITDGWMSLDNIVERTSNFPDFMHAETIGYLVFEDDDIVIVAQTIDLGAGMLMNAQVIAKTAIYERIIL